MIGASKAFAKSPDLDRAKKKALKSGTFHGIELVDSVARLCAMNMLLHGIGGAEGDGLPEGNALPVTTKDALAGKHGEYDMVLANPPFGGYLELVPKLSVFENRPDRVPGVGGA